MLCWLWVRWFLEKFVESLLFSATRVPRPSPSYGQSRSACLWQQCDRPSAARQRFHFRIIVVFQYVSLLGRNQLYFRKSSCIAQRSGNQFLSILVYSWVYSYTLAYLYSRKYSVIRVRNSLTQPWELGWELPRPLDSTAPSIRHFFLIGNPLYRQRLYRYV